MNSVVLTGRLTKDPEMRYTPGNNTAVTTFTLAVDKGLSRDKKTEAEAKGLPTADFINIICFGKTAQNVANFVTKGLQVAVSGRIQTRSYEDSNGGGRRIWTEILANQVEFLEWKDRNQQQGGSYNNSFESNSFDDHDDFSGFEPRNDDNIPF